MKQCPHCNSEILDDSIFCDRCGQRLMACADCGAFVRGKFCRNCGSKNIIDALEYEQRQKTVPESEPESITDVPTQERHTATLTSADGSITLQIDDSAEYIIGRKSPQFGKQLINCRHLRDWREVALTHLRVAVFAVPSPYAPRHHRTAQEIRTQVF